MTTKPSHIIGVRLGELTADLTNPAANKVIAKFFLLGNPDKGHLNLGAFTKTHWSDETVEAFTRFLEAVESDAMQDLFGDHSEETISEAPASLKFPPVPVLGGTKRSDPT